MQYIFFSAYGGNVWEQMLFMVLGAKGLPVIKCLCGFESENADSNRGQSCN